MSTQNFSNHAKTPTSLMAVAGVVVLALILIVAAFFMRHTHFYPPMVAGSVLLCFALIFLGFVARTYSLTLQDRLIRLEMEIRMARLLPADLQDRARNLDIGQRVALRFAADDELPGLVRKVLDENIKDRSAIKKLIKNWQPDHQRV